MSGKINRAETARRVALRALVRAGLPFADRVRGLGPIRSGKDASRAATAFSGMLPDLAGHIAGLEAIGQPVVGKPLGKCEQAKIASREAARAGVRVMQARREGIR
jgi:hypothetical protein